MPEDDFSRFWTIGNEIYVDPKDVNCEGGTECINYIL